MTSGPRPRSNTASASGPSTRRPNPCRRSSRDQGDQRLLLRPRHAQGLLQRAQGRAARPRARRRRRLDRRPARRPVGPPLRPALCRIRRRARPDQGQPAARFHARRRRGLLRQQRRPRQRAARQGFPLHRLRALHARAAARRARARRPLVVGRAKTRRNAVCTSPPTAACCARRSRRTHDPAHPSAKARSREHPHLPRSRGGMRKAGVSLFDRQGFGGAAASGDEGVLSVQAAVPAAACRHDLEVPRDDRIPRPAREGSRAGAARAHQRGRREGGRQSVRFRLARCTPT